MSRRLSLRTFGLVLVTAAASCAAPSPTPRAEPETSSPAATTESACPTCERKPCSPADAATRAAPPAESGDTLTLRPKDGGWRIDELLDVIGEAAGVSIHYDGVDASFKQAKVTVCGDHVIRRSDLFDWLQAVLSYRDLVIVPVGPKTPDGKPRWLVMKSRAVLNGRPPFIDENEVVNYAERDGLYIVTMLHVGDTVDPTRVRNALSLLSTQAEGVGRIRVTGGRDLIVGDFAPVVASMKRMLDGINAEAATSAASAAATPEK